MAAKFSANPQPEMPEAMFEIGLVTRFAKGVLHAPAGVQGKRNK